MDWLSNFVTNGANTLATVFIVVIGLVVLAVVIVFVADVLQTSDAIRRNFPVIGRFRGLFTHLGEFFRQYFFAMDREEMPFNRAERDWIYHSASGGDNTVAFGSTKSLNTPGTVLFANTPFPSTKKESTSAPAICIGPNARAPYHAQSIINISAMSFGALSAPAVQALSKGAKLAGCWLNTGEGGIAPHHLSGGCDIVFQIGTAKYGVRDDNGGLDDEKLRAAAAHPQVKMIELKLAQGAKPGKGGILPGAKVTEEIAKIRGIPAGHDSISPNRHNDAGNVAELLGLISHIRQVSGLPTGFKMVIGSARWLDELCAAIVARGPEEAPDFITVDGGEGGTGAAPMPLMDDVGLPVRAALPLVVDALARHGLRGRIRVICSGKLITPAEVAWAYCTGADFVASARGFLFSLGCIQSMKCNKNTCPTGITTHDARLQKGLDPEVKSVRVKNYVDKIRYGTGIIAHSCGVAHPRALARHHCLIVQPDTTPVALDALYPLPEPPAGAHKP